MYLSGSVRIQADGEEIALKPTKKSVEVTHVLAFLLVFVLSVCVAPSCDRPKFERPPVDHERHELMVHTTRRVSVLAVHIHNSQTRETHILRKQTEGEYRPQNVVLGLPRELHIIYELRPNRDCADYPQPALEVDGERWATRDVYFLYVADGMECVYQAYPPPSDI